MHFARSVKRIVAGPFDHALLGNALEGLVAEVEQEMPLHTVTFANEPPVLGLI